MGLKKRSRTGAQERRVLASPANKHPLAVNCEGASGCYTKRESLENREVLTKDHISVGDGVQRCRRSR